MNNSTHFGQVESRIRMGSLLRAIALGTCLALGSFVSQGLAASNQLQITRNGLGSTQYVSVGLNKSFIVDLPVDASEVIVSDPNTAGAIMRTKRRAIIQGVAAGETNIFFLDSKGARISVVEVSVTQDTAGLSSIISRLLPGSKIRVETVPSAGGVRVVLSGTAQSTDDIDKAVAVASQFAGGDANVANVVTVAGGQQVALKVTVAEVKREVVKQLGISLSGSTSVGGIATSLLSTQSLGGASNVVTSNGLSASGAFGNLSIDAELKALERRGAVRTLAEPTLTAMSGQSAEFKAGGEYPVPTSVDDGTISYSFKEFGVSLNFTPTVKSNGVIALTVETSVSEPTTDGGYTVGDVTIQATKERSANTSVELPSGATLAIAGLMQDQVRQQISQLPGLGNIPILGALFRSRDFIHSKTELVILVTPVIATAGGPIELPTDNYQISSDAEAIFLGRMQKLYGAGNCASTCSTASGYTGSVGFVLD